MNPTNSEPFEIEVVDGVPVARPKGSKKPKLPTGGSPLGCALFAILICLGLLGAAWWSMQSRESVCEVTSRGVSGNTDGSATAEVGFSLRLGNDRSAPARVWLPQPSWAEAEAVSAEYPLQASYPCWYNPLFPTYITLSPDQTPAIFLFWGIMATLFFVSGFGLASFWIMAPARHSPPGQHLPHRLVEEGGGIGSVLRFLLWITPFGVGIIYALVQVLRALWLLPGEDPKFFRLITLIILGLALVGFLAVLYWIGKYVYRLFIQSRTELELEVHPLKPGQKLRLHVRHQAGRLPTESLRLSLVSFEMTDEQHRNLHSQAKSSNRYGSNIHRRDNIFIGGQDHLEQRSNQVWEGDFFLTIPATAKPSVDTGFPQIRWEIKLQVKVAKGPDFEVNYPVTVVEA